MKYINVKKVITIISAGFIVLSVGGCKAKKYNDDSNGFHNINTEVTKKVENQILDNSDEKGESEETIPTEKINEDEKDEEEIITYFENLEEDVDFYLDDLDFDKVKDKVKNAAIAGIDFIFYDKEIKGVTFNELTSATKDKILTIMASIDSKIESKIPEYKETIKEKFGKGYDYINEKLHDGINYADDKLEDKYGQDYNNIKDKTSQIKDEVKESAGSTIDTIKDKTNQGFTKVKDWYEDKTGKR